MSIKNLLQYKCVFKIMLGIAVLFGALPQVSIAMPVDSQAAFQSELAADVYMQKIQSFLNKQVVQKRLAKMGISSEQINDYVNSMDEPQLKQLASRIDTVEAGADGAVVVLLVLLLIFIAVLYFTDYGVKLEPRERK